MDEIKHYGLKSFQNLSWKWIPFHYSEESPWSAPQKAKNLMQAVVWRHSLLLWMGQQERQKEPRSWPGIMQENN